MVVGFFFSSSICSCSPTRFDQFSSYWCLVFFLVVVICSEFFCPFFLEWFLTAHRVGTIDQIGEEHFFSLSSGVSFFFIFFSFTKEESRELDL